MKEVNQPKLVSNTHTHERVIAPSLRILLQVTFSLVLSGQYFLFSVCVSVSILLN